MKLIAIILFSISTAFGASFKVLKHKGSSATYNSEAIEAGKSYEAGSDLETHNDYVKVEFMNGHTIVVGKDSKMKIELNEDNSATFLQGSFRYKSDDSSKKPTFKTKQASFGVRGTDFYLKANALLGESEIVLFDGNVTMTNLEDSTNSFDLKPGQWGGRGGRFGQKIAPPLDLTKQILSHFSRYLDW